MSIGPPKMTPLQAEQLAAVQRLYDAGLPAQAYRLGASHSPLQFWGAGPGQILAGRIASALGASRLSRWLHRCAYHARPDLAETCYFYGSSLAQTKGIHAVWRWYCATELPANATMDIRASWHALAANILSGMRDFQAANAQIYQARETDPTSPWVLVCAAYVREGEDRYKEALQLAENAMALRADYRPAIQCVAHLLTLLGRDAEALALLADANGRLEYSGLAAQQYAIEIELGDYAAAARSLDRCETVSLLLEKPGRKWLAAQRAEVAYQQGDLATAIHFGKQSEEKYWKSVVGKLQEPGAEHKKHARLKVGFVRQNHLTCVPATLTAISRYWSMPADHLQVADEICYNGTTHYNERKWAREHGWIAREFSVTEAATHELIERGIPFTFTTVDPNSAHLQAIVGYDSRRGTVTVRDPYFRNSGEALVENLLDDYRAHGPRGMALVPTSESHRLDGLDLPDETLWDQLHALDGALIQHRRQAAGEIVAEIQAAAPTHRLTLEARRRLATYDGNSPEMLAVVSEIAAQFPKNQTMHNARLALMREQSHRDERLAIYKRLLAGDGTHPIFWQQYARELEQDARQHDEAIWRLKRAIRRWPTEPSNYRTLANIHWSRRQFEIALELYRIAACLGERDEIHLEAYFKAACWFKKSEEVLNLLRERATRVALQSSSPAMSLAWALVELDRTSEAFTVLEVAMAARPEDGELMVYMAGVLFDANSDNLAKSRALLERARDKAPPTQWLRASARLARADGQPAEALKLWREVLQTQPLAIDAHQAVARIIAETDGPPEALRYLSAATEKLPHFYPLQQLRAEWVRDEPADIREPVLRSLAEAYPHDAWTQRELAFFLVDTRRWEEANAAMAAARRLEPESPALAQLQSMLLQHAGNIPAARSVLEAAIRQCVDDQQAIRGLMDLCATRSERRAALTLIRDELVKQVTFGSGLLSYREHARGTLEPDELVGLLHSALADRPDLWHAWSALTQQYLSMNQLEKATSLAQQATERFPLVPQLWLDRAEVSRTKHDSSAEIESLLTAYRIAPRWNMTVSGLADCWARRGSYQEARELLERAVQRDPLDGVLRGLWAEALWRDGQREAAVKQLQKLVQLDPGYERSWELLGVWAAEIKQPEIAMETVRDLTTRRGGEARSWMMLAKLLGQSAPIDERLQAVAKAQELSPRYVDAYDLQAVILAGASRWQEALAACQPSVFQGHPPESLVWRAAWIEVQRGNIHAAIDRLRKDLLDEPNRYAAWSLLADCYVQLGNDSGYTEAAEALVRIAPQNAISFGYLGEARQRKNDLAGAEDAYQKAFTLNPQYEFAGNGLFDVQVERGDLAAAEKTIRTLRSHGNGHYVLAREVRLAMLLNDLPRAQELIYQLAIEPELQPGALKGAISVLASAWQTSEALSALERASESPDMNAEAAGEWVLLRLERKPAGLVPQLLDLLSRHPQVGKPAIYAYVETLVKQNQLYALRSFIRHHERVLKIHDLIWGAVVYAFVATHDYRAAARWSADWRGRSSVEPWMLVNVVEGLRAMNRGAEARAVSLAAIALRPDHGTPLHYIWLACDAAADGDIATSEQLLSNVPGDGQSADYQFLLTCVRSTIAMARSPGERVAAVFPDVMQKMRAARSQYSALSQEPQRKGVYRRCLKEIARQRGTWWAKISCTAEWLLSF